MPIAFILLSLTLVVLVGATGAEYVWGTEFAVRHVYHSLWFFLLWAATAAAAVPCLRGSRARRLWLWHGALLAVLLGAGLSALTSRSGSLRLRLGVAATAYAAEGQGGAEVALPFRVELTDFDVERHAGTTMPPAARLGAERLFHRMPSLAWLLLFTLGPGLLLFIGWLCGLHEAVFSRLVCAVRWLLPLVWLVLTVILGLRTYLGGRLPVGSGYETMLLGAWLLLLFACCASLRRRGGVRQGADEVLWLLALPLMAAGLFLLVARFSERGAAAIAQLTPVLESPLLSLHVGFTMMSYALLSLASLHAAAVLLRPSACAPSLAVLRTRLLLLVGEALLGVGIFLGAWWANEAWGRYWGWDPKEVWALVTWLLYAFPLHAASMPALRRPATFHAWVALAFLALVTTYFGVNFVLGGLHGYA